MTQIKKGSQTNRSQVKEVKQVKEEKHESDAQPNADNPVSKYA